MIYIARSIELPLGVVFQATDPNGKFINLSRYQQFADDEYLKDLSADIKRNGQIEPCCVRLVNAPEGFELPESHEAIALAVQANNLTFELVTGNNRYKAIQMFGGTTVLCNIVDANRADIFNLALSENLSKPLSPIDLAVTYSRMLAFEQLGGAGMKLATLSNRTNQTPLTIKNYLTLLELPQNYQQLIHDSDQNTGKWAKDRDGDKMAKLRPTKARQILAEAEKYVATIVDKKTDPEGFDQHVRLALGRVYDGWENGIKDENTKTPAGTWNMLLVYPQGSRPQATAPISPNTGDSTNDETEGNTETVKPLKPENASAASAGVSAGNKPKKEKVDFRIIGSYLKTLGKDMNGISQTNPVTLAVHAFEVFLAKMETQTLDDQDSISAIEEEFSKALCGFARRYEKVQNELLSYDSAGVSGGTVIAGKVNGKEKVYA